MKPKKHTAILLFISAYSPLFIILSVKDVDFDAIRFRNPIADVSLIVISLISILLLFVTMAKISRGNMIVTVRQVRIRSLDIISYTIPYLFSAFSINLSKIEDIITIVFFMFLLLVLTINTQSIFLNPLLALQGYVFYDLEYEFDGKVYSTVVVSKEELHPGKRFYVRSLTRFLYYATEEEKNT